MIEELLAEWRRRGLLWLWRCLLLALGLTLNAAEFQIPAKCSDIWGPFLSEMVRAGFHPTAATSKDSGVVVMEYRSGAGSYVDKSLVRAYTREQPGALTTYQVFGIQQAAATLVDDANSGCSLTFNIDFVAYKTSFLQTGWLKLASSGAMEATLIFPVRETFTRKREEQERALAAMLQDQRLAFSNPHNCPTKPFILVRIGLFCIPNCPVISAGQAKFCSRCGANVEGMNYCTRCGHKVN